MNNMNSDAVVKNYEEHGALLRGHFLLSSGLHSDAYLQSELIMQDPANAKKVISGLVDVLKDLDFTTIVSPAIGGIRFGYELASQMNKRTLFTERVDGVMTFRRGFTLQKGEKVLVAEDVVFRHPHIQKALLQPVDVKLFALVARFFQKNFPFLPHL